MSEHVKSISKDKSGLRVLRRALIGTAAVAICAATAALAQEEIEIVTVTGYRASLESALNAKRMSAEMVDAINAEDIAAFPDANLAESLQRLPGVSVDRENGEGRTITVRGLSADFTRVTLNGLEALSTAGANDSGSDPNRSRAFDFNTFASELFSGLKVQKSAAADTDEGSLGATVALQTGHPFDFGDKYAISVQNAWYELGKPFNPRITGLASQTFLGGRLGVLGSVAYNMRHQYLDSYQRSPGYNDYLYRQAVFGGSVVPSSGSVLVRAGFSAPTGTSCSGGTSSDNYNGVIPNYTVANSVYCAALSGSNADAYDTVTQGNRGYSMGGTVGKTASTWLGAASGTLIPGLATLNHRDIYQTRIGLTASVQWQVDDRTMIVFDGVFSSTYQDSINYQVSSIGLNRSNASSQMAAVPASLTSTSSVSKITAFESKLSAAYTKYSSCTANSGSATTAKVVCSYAKSSNLYDYYTSGYGASTATGATTANALNSAYSQLIKFLGKPTTKVVSAQVVNNQAVYLQLANVDFSSRADQAYYTTQFEQGSFNINRDFTDRFKMNMQIGMSVSRNRQVGYLASFDRLDSGTYDGTTCTECFVYDATADSDMPVLDLGFDAADPTSWDFVKGYSVLRHYLYLTNNKYRSLKADASYDITDQFTVKAGFSGRIYEFATTKYGRVVKDILNPSMSEINAGEGTSVSVSDLGKVVPFGNGINVPAGTTTSMFVPDLGKMRSFFHFDCNCVNDYGDWTISNLNSYASTTQSGQTYSVGEHDKAYYTQVDFRDILIFGRELRGNIGLRYAVTDIDATGHSTLGDLVSAKHSYDKLLPSINLNYFIADDMMLRASASQVMARPQLSQMAPSITSMSLPSSDVSGTATVSMGNPNLKPYSANTIDIGYEWYFDKGAVISIAAFVKYIKDVPQQTVRSTTFSELLPASTISALASSTSLTDYQKQYLTDDGEVDATQYTSGPGGVLNGIEITFQQQLSFLPAPFDGLGVNGNYTLLHSRMHYILNTSPVVTGDGPWVGASPSSFNFTVYYDGKDWHDRAWSARVSTAFRSSYVSQYPIAAGTADVGYGDSPIMNDFVYSKSTLNLDTSFTYDITDYMQLRIDALNLTNQTDNRYAYKLLGKSAVTRYAATGRQVYAGFRMKF